MLATIVRPLLKEIKDKTGSLKENSFARRLAESIITNGAVPDNSMLLAVLYRDDRPEDLIFRRRSRFPDRRIKSLFLNDVRQYSLLKNGEKDVDFYALDLSVRSKPASSILLGPNGSGKTSLYSSLEYLYQGNSEIASSHGYRDDQIDNFLRSIGASVSNVTIGAEFEKNEEIKDNRLLGYELPAAFCSECDYFEITRKWDEIDYYIAYQLGYREMLQVHKGLSVLKRLLDYAVKYKKITAELSDLEEDMKNQSESVAKLIASEEIQTKRKSQEAVRASFYKLRGKKFTKGIEDFLKDDKNKGISVATLKEVRETYSFIDSLWKKLLGQFLNLAKPIFDKMMKDHLFDGSESFNIIIEKGEVCFNLVVTGNGNEEVKTPIEYFNTFRLKLFCVAFKMSLFCFAKQLHHMNLPFVIDDIFDSSDFYHRSHIGSFIWHMLESHDVAMEKKGKVAYPLQLLFFTQDNIIAENVYRGISDYIFEKNREDDMPVKFGRLFRPCDAKLDEIEYESHQSSYISDVQYNGKSVKVIYIVDYFTQG